MKHGLLIQTVLSMEIKISDKLNASYFSTTLGYWISLFFIPLLILKTTKSALLVSISYALGILPDIIFIPIAGAIADKFNKKHLA